MRLLKKYSDIKEQSSTSIGGATQSPGEGPQYSTPKAFNKYRYKLKNTPIHEEEVINEMNDFQKQRLQSIEDIEKLLNELSPLISNAKNETATLFGGNPGSYDINSPIEITKSYLQDIKRILTEK